jgi:hypothetical protein
MQANYPPGPNLQGRFGQVQSLRLQRLELVGMDQASGVATVAVDLIEVGGSPPVRRRWVGTWQLVRGQSGWLLDNPGIRPG